MKQKKQKQAAIIVFYGIGLFVIGLLISFTSLFKLYGIAGSSNICQSNACLSNVNNDALIAYMGVSVAYSGIALVIIGLIIIVFYSLKKNDNK